MQNQSIDPAALSTEVDESGFAADAGTTEEDPAGGITLSGRSRLVARARVLAGMAMTAGVVAVMNGWDTTSTRSHGL
jgi:hypothetical protein